MDDISDLDAVTMPPQPRRPAPHQADITPASAPLDWAQDTNTVVLFLVIPKGTRARELDVKLLPTSIRVSWRRAQRMDGMLLGGDLCERIKVTESEWELVNGELVIRLTKDKRREWLTPLLTSMSETSRFAASTLSPAAVCTPLSSPPTSVYEKCAAGAHAHLEGADCDAAVRKTSQVRKESPTGSDAKATTLSATYDAWDHFDDVQALMQLENNGKTDDPNWSLRCGQGTAAVQCTDYRKDREEVELDEELAQKRLELQESFNERLRGAARLKEEGNGLLRREQPEAALEAYEDGCAMLNVLHESGAVLLSGRMLESLRTLTLHLHNNAAQAALSARLWVQASAHASQALEHDEANAKALYRRALAKSKLGEDAAARRDSESLLKVEPGNRAAHMLLRQLDPVSEVCTN